MSRGPVSFFGSAGTIRPKALADGGIYHLWEIITYGDPVEIELPFGKILLDTSKLPVAPKDEQRDEWPKLLP